MASTLRQPYAGQICSKAPVVRHRQCLAVVIKRIANVWKHWFEDRAPSMRCTRPIRRRRIISTNTRPSQTRAARLMPPAQRRWTTRSAACFKPLNRRCSTTLVGFQSDNGGTRDPLFAGAITDMSKVVLPADNGPTAMSRASFTRGGTRVVALASWPGQIKEGITVNTMIHTVDLSDTGRSRQRPDRQEQASSMASTSGAP